MGTATTTTTPESAVEALMKQVADENGLEITENLASVPSQTIGKFIFQVFFELRIERIIFTEKYSLNNISSNSKKSHTVILPD